MSMPMNFASHAMGLPMGKKPTRRGRKPSGKPGAQHLAALQQAHGAGNFPMARTHALNYAKATMATAQPDESEGIGAELDTDSAMLHPPMAPKVSMGMAPKAAQPPNRMKMLAALAMKRKAAV